MDKQKLFSIGATIFGAYLLYKGLKTEKISKIPNKIIDTTIQTPKKIMGTINKAYDDLKEDIKEAVDVDL